VLNTDRNVSVRHRRRELLADESGVALFMVLGVMVLMFILATMLISMAVYQIGTTERSETRSKAVQIADAGLNAYLYELRRQSTFYKTNPNYPGTGTGWTTTDEGKWQVTAIPPTGTVPLTLRATGVVPSRAETRVITAQIRFPSFADYAMLSNASISIGKGAFIGGKLHSNGTISNTLGIVTGRVTAVGTISGDIGASYFYQGYKTVGTAGKVDFTKVTMDMTTLKDAAVLNGNYYPDSSAMGYRLVFAGDHYTIDKVTSQNSTSGALTVTNVRTNVPVPPDGVIYVQDDLWVWGTYNTAFTIGQGDPSGSTTYNVRIPESLVAETRDGDYKAGIVAKNSILIPVWYNTPSAATSWTVQAALLAQSGSCQAEFANSSQPRKFADCINFYGSRCYYANGGFVDSNIPPAYGFLARNYIFDPGLDNYPPPSYPVLHDGSLKIVSWVEK
jgi:hypothetical protein